MRYVLAAGLAAGAALVACSLIVPLDERQCAVDSDCAARGGGFAGGVCVNQVCVAPADASMPRDASEASALEAATLDAHDAGAPDADPWGCLANPPEVLNASSQVHLTFELFDALKPITTAGPQGGSDFTVVSYTPVPGISLQACNILDPLCAKPVTPLVVTDDAGVAHVTVAGDFTGFFQFSGPGVLPSALYPGQTLADASSESAPVAVLGTNETQLLAAALGVPLQTNPEAGVGHAFFQVYDCFDRHAAGVSFTILGDAGPQTVQWYSHNELPSTTATQTDSLGAGGAVNVPAGALTLTATVGPTQRMIGTANAVITAGGTTFAWVRVRTH